MLQNQKLDLDLDPRSLQSIRSEANIHDVLLWS